MIKWISERPWIWIVVLLGAVVIGSVVTVIIAEMNAPIIVRP